MVLRSPARRHVLVLLSYGILSLILTYPLILRFATHVPGDGIDDPALTWNLWWVRFSIVEQHTNPFDCRWMFWPVGINLAFYTLTILNGLLSIPLQIAFDVVPASNVLLILSFILSGYGAHLLVWEVWGAEKRGGPPISWGAAWLSGLVYAFSTNKLFYAALGQFNIASSQWIPFCALYVWRMGQRRGRARDAVLAGLFLGFQAWAEATFASFLLIFIAIYALWWAAASQIQKIFPGLTARATSGLLPEILKGYRFVIMAAIFTVIIAPMLVNMLPDLQAEGDFFESGGGFANVFSADLAGYLVPTQHHPLFGQFASQMPFPHDKGQHVYLGYSVMVLALVSMWARPRRVAVFWAITAVIFWALTWGPSLRLMGRDTGLPGLFALIAEWPFFKGNRYPSRYAVMLLLSASMLAARGLASVQHHWPGLRLRLLLGIVAAFFLLEHIAVPLPLSDMRVPAIYRQIAAEADPTRGIVMELPLGWRNGARVVGKKDVVIMFEQWYQTVHHRPILGGNTSRNPEFKFQYFSESPLLDLLIGMVNAADEPLHQALRDELAPIHAGIESAGQSPPDWLVAHRRQAAQVLDILDIAYVVIHRAHVPAELERYVTTVFPVQLVGEGEGLALYRVQHDRRFLSKEIDLTSEVGHLLLGEGWSQPARLADEPAAAVWAQRREVRLQLPISASVQGVEMLAFSPGPDQEAALIVNGQMVNRQPVPETWGWVRFTWQPGRMGEGLLPVRLQFTNLYSPDRVGDTSYRLPNGQSVGVSLLLRSAGEEVGNFAHIYINGIDYSPGRRGYNLVQIDPASGDVLDAASFDTHASAQESQAMAAWLRAMPSDRWVLGAVKDEASLNLTEEAVAALRELGVVTDLRGHFRWSHAFIGAKGWRPGEAEESLAALGPANIKVGLPLSQSYVAAAVASLRLIPNENQ